MHKTLYIFTSLLLTAAALLSCSKTQDLDGEHTVIISGIVSETASNTPLEGVMITFCATDKENVSISSSQNVYTDSNGRYRIESDGFINPMTCTLDVTHPGFSSTRKTILVNWSGPSYDEKKNIFFVNDCNFHLER